MEIEDYKYRVLELLHDGQNDHSTFISKKMMLELRMTLFHLAASSHHTTRPQCLIPFPSCFFDPVKKTKEFARLMKVIDSLPKLDEIEEKTEFEEGERSRLNVSSQIQATHKIVWKLLHWVFTNPLNMTPWTQKTHSDLKSSVQELREMTNLPDIPDSNVLIFEVKNNYPSAAFSEGKKEFGTFFAYHGSGLENYHSIIHRGLMKSLNVRKAYGPGTYLSNQLATSKGYAGAKFGWKRSQLKRLYSESMGSRPYLYETFSIQCVAIVETVDKPEGVKKHHLGYGGERGDLTYFVVGDDGLMQLSHLLLFF